MEGLSFVLVHVEYKVVLFNLAVLRWESSSDPGDLMETHFFYQPWKRDALKVDTGANFHSNANFLHEH